MRRRGLALPLLEKLPGSPSPVSVHSLPQHLNYFRQWISGPHPQITDSQTFFLLLHLCGRFKLLAEGRRLHFLIKASHSLQMDISVSNCVLNMYGRCHSLHDAELAFEEMGQRDVVSWTSMINIYAKHGHCGDAFRVFGQMALAFVSPNDVTFIAILNACNLPDHISECNLVHSLIVICGYESDVPVANAVVTAYARCASADDAFSVFEFMSDRNVLSWTTMIKACAAFRQERALQVFQQMHVEGVQSNTVTYITLVHSCFSPELLPEGKRIHVIVAEIGGFSDVVLGGALVNMYGKCGNVDDALRIFNVLPRRTVITWNSIIGICVHHRQRTKSFHYFVNMQIEGVDPDTVSFITILGICSNPAHLIDGEIIHAFCVEVGFEMDESLGSALVDMYGKCGKVEDARTHFNRLQMRNFLSWSCLISSYLNLGQVHVGIQLFRQMQIEGMQPCIVAFASLLVGLGNKGFLNEGKIIHLSAIESQAAVHEVVGSSLISMYGRMGCFREAEKVFDGVEKRNVIVWNALIGAYNQNAHVWRCCQLFQSMVLNDVEPSNISFSCILSTCADVSLLEKGKLIHFYIVACNKENDMIVGSALINFYGKCSRLQEAQWVFDNRGECNSITWNSIITAHAHHRNCEQVLNIFEQMKSEGVSPSESTILAILEACSLSGTIKDGEIVHAIIIEMCYDKISVIGNALINMYGGFGILKAAQTIFNKIEERNLASWNAMIGVYAIHKQILDIFQLFEIMLQEHAEFDQISLVHVLYVCARLSVLAEGQILYSCAVERGIQIDIRLANVLICMYSKAGHMDDARTVFDNLPQHDAISWTSIIVAYAEHAYANEALELFQYMSRDGIKPNAISFLSILTACSHAGLVDLGCKLLLSMEHIFAIIPASTHYNCLVDLLGRSGQLDEAEDLISKIPILPDRVLLVIMLSVCKTHEDFRRANRIANTLFLLEHHCLASFDELPCHGILVPELAFGADVNLDSPCIGHLDEMSIDLNTEVSSSSIRDLNTDEIYIELRALSERELGYYRLST